MRGSGELESQRSREVGGPHVGGCSLLSHQMAREAYSSAIKGQKKGQLRRLFCEELLPALKIRNLSSSI
jgi:hypothetical protein